MDILKIEWDGCDFLERGKSFYTGAKILNHLKFFFLRNQRAIELLKKAMNNKLPTSLREEIEQYIREELY